jgi:hypothetical protein
MNFKNMTRPARHLHLVILALSSFAVGCSGQLINTEPTLEDALDASSSDLAMGYLSVKHTVRFVAIGERATVTIGNVTINKDNVDEYKAKYEARLRLYEQAIRQRGFEDISGHYQGEATESCARSNSFFAAVIEEYKQPAIVITQDGIDAKVVITVEHEGKDLSQTHAAAVAGSAVALNEATNSDYYFRGEMKNSAIVFKPEVMVLKTWPKWANPPSRKDLENCMITLERAD